MTGKFRNNLQAAILYDGHADVFRSTDLNKFRMAMLQKGIPFQVSHESPGFVLMTGPDELQLSWTYHAKPADHAVFRTVLASPTTRMHLPDADDRVQRHGSHVLIEIQQGVLGSVQDIPKFATFFDEIEFPRPGHNLAGFNHRVDILADACMFLNQEKPASAVHWTQSNTLIAGEHLEDYLSQPRPGFLTIHPFIMGGDAMPGHKEIPIEIYTIGAVDYIGREIHTDLAPVPWLDLYSSITAFVEMATMPDGYIIPDGDTWGVDDDEFCWRVTHPDGKKQSTINGEPFFNLKLLYHRSHGYTAPDFTGRKLIKGGIAEASALLQGPEQAVREEIDDWKKTEDMARKAGGGFEIYRTNDPANGPVGMSAPPKTPLGSGGNRSSGVFGKRKT